MRNQILKIQTFFYFREKRLRRVFEIFDKDGNNHIDVNELKKAVKQLLNKSITTTEAERMVGSVDVNNDGVINFQEFTIIMKNFA